MFKIFHIGDQIVDRLKIGHITEWPKREMFILTENGSVQYAYGV